MKKDIFKKIIPLACLTFFLVNLFTPFHSVFAQVQCGSPQAVGPNAVGCIPAPGSYQLLQPLPDLTYFNPTPTDAFGKYLNILIPMFIGLCAVLAVVMIVIGGIEYSTSELISSKEAGIEKIKGAILGLLLALGAYVILKEINPDLLKTDVAIEGVTVNVVVKDFILSSGQTIDGKPGSKVDLKTIGCPAATAAGSTFKMDRALLLAVFQQESSQTINAGGCLSDGTPNKSGQTANMYPEDVSYLKNTLLPKIGKSWPVYVSCASSGGGNHGGAMGPMQFLPNTWKTYGQGRSPWDINAAMMAAAAKLAHDGIISRSAWDQNQALMYYFDKGQTCTAPDGSNYCQSVEGHKVNFQKQIADGVCG